MITIGIKFPAGRYHATPWGRHVNEADVEWPPSPWRIIRALVATWYRKVDSAAFPKDLLAQLVEKLATNPPAYHLPRATHAHSRHYMPMREGKKEKPVLIFDAFARTDPESELLVHWPDVELAQAEQALLDELLLKLGYLGRAESWAEARRIENAGFHANCTPVTEKEDHITEGHFEPVQAIAPMDPDSYIAWRRTAESQTEALDLKPKKRRALQATIPASISEAVQIETADMKAAGWSQPPGTQWVSYRRPADCFTPRYETDTPVQLGKRCTTVRLALAGKPLPRIEDALRIGELVRVAAMSHAKSLPNGVAPTALSGHGLPEDSCHGHAFYLPECNDGRIAHVLVHAPDGLDAASLQLLARIGRIWERNGNRWKVIFEAYGDAADFDGHPYLGSARVWQSVTPYLHPWYRKNSLTVRDQLLRECRLRGLPEPQVESLPSIPIRGRARRPVHFHRFRSRHVKHQPDRQGGFWRLTFPEPIQGPLALGFACHFGLGLFGATSH